MNIAKVNENVELLVKDLKKNKTFVYELLQAYGVPQASITRLKKGDYNLAKSDTEIYWKKKLLFKEVTHEDLHATIDDLRGDKDALRHDPRFIIVTDYKQLLALDTKEQDTLDIKIEDISKHYAFFLPWAGMEKSSHQTENIADIKAAEKMARLYDEIIKHNTADSQEFYHNLNIFFSRLLFCFFAEDTEVFEKMQFTKSIGSHTQKDGSDLNTYLDDLFKALDVEDKANYPDYLAQFPYVNGGLFNKETPAPRFSAKARKLILECGDLDWSQINPDIFGSMIQAVVHPGQRSGLGMHYTSVTNIMKVINPLFLEEIKEELDKAFGDTNKLEKLLNRIYNIKVFDPACGSGNFLIIAYKELRKIEHQILEQILEGKLGVKIGSGLKLENFYGIEIDEFAREIAVLSLWLAKHQMNIEFKKKFGKEIPLIPLKDTGNVVCSNAVAVNWDDVCNSSENAEVYLIGNPPYLGTRNQKEVHKKDKEILSNIPGFKSLDYIAIWFYKGANFIRGNTKQKLAFVTTNSINQGDQVAILWPSILKDLEVAFANTSFKWTNNAKKNAGVTVSIVSLRNKLSAEKRIYNGSVYQSASNINAYLADGPDVYIGRRNKSIAGLPKMSYGNYTGGCEALMLTPAEKQELLESDPRSEKFIRKLVGSAELNKAIERYCLWIPNSQLEDAMQIKLVSERVNKVRETRLGSEDKAIKKLASRPHQFRDTNVAVNKTLIVPIVFSERRDYIPCDFLGADTIVPNSAQAIYDPEDYLFGVISSRMHMVWVKTTSGRLKTDYRYSSVLAYNNFPMPQLTTKQKEMITNNVYEIIDIRERHTELTLGDMYIASKMPSDLKRAHADLDEVVEACYRVRPFDSDEDRLSHLFKLYEKMTAGQEELLHA